MNKVNLLDAGKVRSDEVNKSTYKLVNSEGGSTKKPNTKNDYTLMNFGAYPNREIINNDKFYLLSEEELFYGEKVKFYGFADSDAIADVNRRFLSTGYAKFKGIWFSAKY